jgi:phosphatidylglycerophosphatase A
MRRLIITFFYTGLSPIAPGTVGSLAASGVLLGILHYNNPTGILHYTDPTWPLWQWELLGGLFLACYFSVAFGKWAIRYYHRKDPQMFVLDEVAGICLTNLFQTVISWQSIAIAFVMFRIFDVIKPPPCKDLEKSPAGWGILLDDLAAAVYANLLCRLVIHFVL